VRDYTWRGEGDLQMRVPSDGDSRAFPGPASWPHSPVRLRAPRPRNLAIKGTGTASLRKQMNNPR
jgi:hypothetical protein